MSAIAMPRVERDRAVEMLAVILLGIATVGSAWCAYQAARWNGEETREAREAGLARIESSRLFTLAAQQIAYDATLTSQYAQAVASGDDRLVEFYRANLVRKAYLPVLTAWQEEIAAGGNPASPIIDGGGYIDEQLAPSRAVDATADAATARSADAAANSDDYILTTVITASALFFAGVTSSFRTLFPRVILLALAGVILAVAAARIVDLPVA